MIGTVVKVAGPDGIVIFGEDRGDGWTVIATWADCEVQAKDRVRRLVERETGKVCWEFTLKEGM
jgi:hypothetical protein